MSPAWPILLMLDLLLAALGILGGWHWWNIVGIIFFTLCMFGGLAGKKRENHMDEYGEIVAELQSITATLHSVSSKNRKAELWQRFDEAKAREDEFLSRHHWVDGELVEK
jgi:hypothetical protein